VIGTPCPVVTAGGDAVEAALEAHHPGPGLSARQRAWRACCGPARLGTPAVGWARVARVSLGGDALAAVSWRVRHAKLPWALRRVARVRLRLRPAGMTPGGLVRDDPAQRRAQAARPSAARPPRRDQASGGGLLGQSLVVLLCGTPKRPRPLGVTCSRPAPELTAWETQERRLQQPGIARQPRPPTPPPKPPYPTQHALALCLLQPGKAQHPALTGQGRGAEARQGTAACGEDAASICPGVPGISQRRRHQMVRADQRESPGAASWATQPGTPQQIRRRGGAAGVAIVGSARLYVSAHRTKRCLMALQ
jgi:hypothetical protein